MARPKGSGKYKKEYDNIAYVACVEGGFTIAKIAKLFSVDRATVYRWIDKESSFRDSINTARDKFDTLTAEKSLYKRLNGFRFKETIKERVVSIDETTGEVETKLVVTKEVSKQQPPDVTALIFFLKNRQPDRWRDVKRSELTGEGGGPIQLERSDIDLKKLDTEDLEFLEHIMEKAKVDEDA